MTKPKHFEFNKLSLNLYYFGLDAERSSVLNQGEEGYIVVETNYRVYAYTGIELCETVCEDM